MKKSCIVIFLHIIAGICLFGQDLSITPEDLIFELRADGGFHLFVRKKPDINSVLLTETTKDPSMNSDSFAYRAGEWNAINGDEIRLLNGVPIPAESRIYSLVSSTVINHPVFGQAFHIYIPYIIYYGYEDSRHGEVYLTDGTFLNIRSFSLPHADYRGAFKDNPFVLEAKQEPPMTVTEVIPEPVTTEVISEPAVPETKHESQPDPAQKYTPETVKAFEEIAKSGGGDIIFSSGPDDTIEQIRKVLEAEKGKNLDLVICLDTTNSMRKYINAVRAKLIPMLREMLINFPSFRIGMVLYKDYGDTSYLTRIVPFTDDFNKFQRDLNDIRVIGGGDIPEAVYEALYEGAIGFPWEREAKVMILIGDAPPHPKPRGKITKVMVNNVVNDKKIKVHAMVMPQ
jgi:hypothetical protein